MSVCGCCGYQGPGGCGRAGGAAGFQPVPLGRRVLRAAGATIQAGRQPGVQAVRSPSGAPGSPGGSRASATGAAAAANETQERVAQVAVGERVDDGVQK